jgi:dimethylargininase
MTATVVTSRDVLSAPYVRSDTAKLTAALVVQPSFALENAVPAQSESSPIVERAFEQHDLLVARLRAHGVAVTVLSASEDTPFGVVAADLAVVFENGAVLMRPSDLARRREVTRIESALREAGIPIAGLIEPPGLLDGGDVLLGDGVVYIGAPHNRSSGVGVARPTHGNASGRQQMAALAQGMGLKTVEVAMDSDVFRLRGVAALVDRDRVLLASACVDAAAFGDLKRIEVPPGEDYGAGVLAYAPSQVIENLRFRTVLPLLRGAKVWVDAIDVWEFGKLGITPSTLVLALKRA